MEKSIINSLKRLDRVGSETSIVTKKLKKSVEVLADKIFEYVKDFRKEYRYEEGVCFTRITKTDLYIVEDESSLFLSNDYDGLLAIENYRHDRYEVQNSLYMSRECALSFSKAVADGMLDQISKWLTEKKEAAEKALKEVETATKRLSK